MFRHKHTSVDMHRAGRGLWGKGGVGVGEEGKHYRQYFHWNISTTNAYTPHTKTFFIFQQEGGTYAIILDGGTTTQLE